MCAGRARRVRPALQRLDLLLQGRRRRLLAAHHRLDVQRGWWRHRGCARQHRHLGQHAFLRRARQLRSLPVDETSSGAGARVGHRLASVPLFISMASGACRGEEPGERAAVLGVRVVHHPQRTPALGRRQQQQPRCGRGCAGRSRGARRAGAPAAGNSASVRMNTGSRRPGGVDVGAVLRDGQASVWKISAVVIGRARARCTSTGTPSCASSSANRAVRLGSLRAPLEEGSTRLGCVGCSGMQRSCTEHQEAGQLLDALALMRIAMAKAPISGRSHHRAPGSSARAPARPSGTARLPCRGRFP